MNCGDGVFIYIIPRQAADYNIIDDNLIMKSIFVNEDDHGDFCTAAPLQCNGFGATVRCTDKSVGENAGVYTGTIEFYSRATVVNP